jgi:hypothetical protein
MNDRSGSRTRAARAVAASERGGLGSVGRVAPVGVVGEEGFVDGAGALRAVGSPPAGSGAAVSPERSGGPVEQAASSSATTAPAGPVLPTVPA